MNENEFWSTLWIVMGTVICVIAGCITWAVMHRDPGLAKEQEKTERISYCIRYGGDWVNEDCTKRR